MKALRRFTFILVAVAAFATQAFGAYTADLVMVPTTPTIPVGGVATITIQINNIQRTSEGDTDNYLAAVDIELSLDPNLSILTGGAYGDGFLESAGDVVPTHLLGSGTGVDGTLSDADHHISYVKDFTDDLPPGIPVPAFGADPTDYTLGTFSVTSDTPSGVGDPYLIRFSDAGLGTALLTESVVAFGGNQNGADVTVTPEPATILLGLGSLGMMLFARGRRRKEEK